MLRLSLVFLSLCCLAAHAPAADLPEADRRLMEAARAASDLYQRHVAELRVDLAGDDDTARLVAIDRLSRLGDPTILDDLLPFLDADVYSQDLVIATAAAVARTGDERGVGPLTLLTRRDEDALRSAATNGLAVLRARTGFSHNANSLEDIDALRASGVTMLGTIEAGEAGEVLANALLHDKRRHIRRMAAISLRQLGDAGWGQALTDALVDPDPLVRRYAAEALATLNVVAAVPYLLMALEGDLAGNHIASALVTLTGEDFGYTPNADIMSRQAVINRGFRWWTETGSAMVEP